MNLSETTVDPAVLDTDEDSASLSRSTSPVGDFLAVETPGDPTPVLRLDDAALSGDGYVAEVDVEAGLLRLVDTNPEENRETLVSLSGDHGPGADAEAFDGTAVASAIPEPDGATADVVDRVSAAPTARFGPVAIWNEATVERLSFGAREAESTSGEGRLEATTRSVEQVVVSRETCVVTCEAGTTLLESSRIVDVRFEEASGREVSPSGAGSRRDGERVEAGFTSGGRSPGGGTGADRYG